MNLIKRSRYQLKLSQIKLGEKIGVTGQHISRLERNEDQPMPSMLLSLECLIRRKYRCNMTDDLESILQKLEASELPE